MPFESLSQLRTCYSRNYSKWDCDKWLRHTPSICSLPQRKEMRMKSRRLRQGEKIKGQIKTGPRGGKFFLITEKSKSGKIKCQIKVYI